MRQVAKLPYGYAVFPYTEPPNEAIRYTVVKGTYWIIYEVSTDSIEVIDIIHAAQNPELFKSTINS